MERHRRRYRFLPAADAVERRDLPSTLPPGIAVPPSGPPPQLIAPDVPDIEGDPLSSSPLPLTPAGPVAPVMPPAFNYPYDQEPSPPPLDMPPAYIGPSPGDLAFNPDITKLPIPLRQDPGAMFGVGRNVTINPPPATPQPPPLSPPPPTLPPLPAPLPTTTPTLPRAMPFQLDANALAMAPPPEPYMPPHVLSDPAPADRPGPDPGFPVLHPDMPPLTEWAPGSHWGGPPLPSDPPRLPLQFIVTEGDPIDFIFGHMPEPAGEQK